MRLLLALLAALLPVPALAGPPDVSGLEWQPHPGGAVPEVALRTSDGRLATLAGLAGGRPVIVDLGYYKCPTLCGEARDDLLTARSASPLRAGEDYTLLALSIDPAETPQVAAEAKAIDVQHYPAPGAGAGWVYATGDAPAVSAVADAIGFPSRWDEGLKQFLHPTGVAILGGDGRISGYVFGVGYDPAGLAAAVGQARAGMVPPLPSPVLLLCYHYDPVTGVYSIAIMKVVRLAAAGIVLAIGCLLLRLRLARRRAA